MGNNATGWKIKYYKVCCYFHTEYRIHPISCVLLFLVFYRGWEQVLPKKGESTFEILRSTEKTSFGKMNLMEMQSSWHSVRKKLKIGRPGFVTLRFNVYH